MNNTKIAFAIVCIIGVIAIFSLYSCYEVYRDKGAVVISGKAKRNEAGIDLHIVVSNSDWRVTLWDARIDLRSEKMWGITNATSPHAARVDRYVFGPEDDWFSHSIAASNNTYNIIKPKSVIAYQLFIVATNGIYPGVIKGEAFYRGATVKGIVMSGQFACTPFEIPVEESGGK